MYFLIDNIIGSFKNESSLSGLQKIPNVLFNSHIKSYGNFFWFRANFRNIGTSVSLTECLLKFIPNVLLTVCQVLPPALSGPSLI